MIFQGIIIEFSSIKKKKDFRGGGLLKQSNGSNRGTVGA